MILDLILIGAAIALDPIALTPFLLILASKGGVRKGAAFMLGWLGSLAFVMAATLLITGGHPPSHNSAPSIAALVIKLIIGAGLVIFGERRRRRMHGPKQPKKVPKWQTGIDNMSPWFALMLAPLVQPYGLIAAGVTVIVGANLDSWVNDLALLLFALLASAIVISLELLAAFKPVPAQAFIQRVRAWIDGHLDQAVVVLFLAIGLYLVASSIYELAT